MESYDLIRKLDSSRDSKENIAVKYDAGKVKSEKYGEAEISGHFLLTTRHGKFPPVLVKQVEEQAYICLKEIGLEKLKDYVTNQLQLPENVAFNAPGVDPKKLHLYFKYLLFLFLFDDAVLELNQLNKNDSIRQQKDVLNVAENLVSIIESHGNDDVTEAAASKLNPIFKSTCTVLSRTCSQSFKQMSEDDYNYFARELLDFVRVNKWMQEYNNSPYSEDELYLLRRIDGGVSAAIFLICLAKDIHISNEIKMHPIYQRYYNNVSTHVAITNDILSTEKESAANEKLNLVFLKCQKYSLQQSIYQAEKAANEIVIGLKKDKIRLKLYFPKDESLKLFLKTAEYAVDGFLYWHQCCKRYGNIKFETYVVEYNDNYNSWLKQIRIIDAENMKEPRLSSKLSK